MICGVLEKRSMLPVLAAASTAVLLCGFLAPANADLVGHGGIIRSIAVSSDSGRVLTASFDFSARLWQFDEQKELLSLDRHDGPVNAVRFLPGDDRAVSVGADGKTVVWSLADGAVEREYTDHQGRVMAVAVSPGGDAMMTGGWDGRLAIRPLEGGDGALVIETGVPVVGIAFGAGGGIVIAGGRDGHLRVYRASDGGFVDDIPAHDLGLTAIAATADGARMVSIGLDNAARVWRTRDMRMTAEFFADPVVKPVAVAIDAAGKTAAVTYIDGFLIHFDTTTAETLQGFRVDETPVWAVGLSGDGRFAVTAGMDERARVWHLESADAIDVASAGDSDTPTPWYDSDDPGAVLFRKCANCHALTAAERQRAGPHFEGLFGRRAGAVESYRYSSALRRTDVVWGRETIAELFRIGPDRFMPGTKMPVQQIPGDAALDALVDYMETIVPGG